MGGRRPPIAPLREDGAESAPPPARWLELKISGCCRQAVHNPDRLLRVPVQELVDIYVVHAWERAGREDGKHVGVCPG